MEDLLNPPQNENATPTPPATPGSPSAHNDSEDSQPPDQPAPPGSALAIRDANSQSDTPVKTPKSDKTPEKDKIPEKNKMFVEDEVKKEPGTPCGQVETSSPQDAKQACSISEEAPRDTFYSSDGTSSMDVQPGEGTLRQVVVDSTRKVGPKEVKDLETGEGTLDMIVDSVVGSTKKVGPKKPKKTGKSTAAPSSGVTSSSSRPTGVGSMKVLKPRLRFLGETFIRSPLPHEHSAISLSVIPTEDSRVSDLDTRSPVNSLPLRRYPSHPNLNTLLIPSNDLQRTHLDNLHGRSKSGKNAGKSQFR